MRALAFNVFLYTICLSPLSSLAEMNPVPNHPKEYTLEKLNPPKGGQGKAKSDDDRRNCPVKMDDDRSQIEINKCLRDHESENEGGSNDDRDQEAIVD